MVLQMRQLLCFKQSVLGKRLYTILPMANNLIEMIFDDTVAVNTLIPR